MTSGRFGVGIIDTMIGFATDPDRLYAKLRQELLRDRESRESFAMPAEYMFHDVPEHPGETDPVAFTLAVMDRHGIEIGLVSLSAVAVLTGCATTDHPTSFLD